MLNRMPGPDSCLISVVIPVRNRESLIVPCINSVAQQTYPPQEIIVVDDCSTDGTWRKLERAAQLEIGRASCRERV